MKQHSTAVVGMDVHKESVDIAIADGKEARLFGRVGGDAIAVERAVRKFRSVHRDPLFVYEAGPCGFWLYRRLRAQGLRCMVVSPSMTPRRLPRNKVVVAIARELSGFVWAIAREVKPAA